MTAPGGASADDRMRKLRHDLSNPLSAILAEAQLLLLEESLDDQAAQSMREIERLSHQMREILKKA